MNFKEYKNQHSPRFNWIVKKINDTTDDVPQVLDVGIEPYIFAKILVEELSDVDLYGINYNDSEDRIVSGESVILRSCNVEAESWPFDSDHFDIVVMSAIIEHLFHPYPALSEARWVLKND